MPLHVMVLPFETTYSVASLSSLIKQDTAESDLCHFTDVGLRRPQGQVKMHCLVRYESLSLLYYDQSHESLCQVYLKEHRLR